jgi:hypothetical protein
MIERSPLHGVPASGWAIARAISRCHYRPDLRECIDGHTSDFCGKPSDASSVCSGVTKPDMRSLWGLWGAKMSAAIARKRDARTRETRCRCQPERQVYVATALQGPT